MWCDAQSPAMMGLQATTSKRKREDGDSLSMQPSKLGRTEESVRDAVASDADPDDWGVDSTSSALATTLLGGTSPHHQPEDEDDDEDEKEEEEDEEEEEKMDQYLPAGRNYLLPANQCVRYTEGPDMSGCYAAPVTSPHSADIKPLPPNVYYAADVMETGYAMGGGPAPTYRSDLSDSRPYCSRQQHYGTGPPRNASYWQQGAANGYYNQEPSSPTQTIRCDENGKSYLDLGSSPSLGVPPTSNNSSISSVYHTSGAVNSGSPAYQTAGAVNGCGVATSKCCARTMCCDRSSCGRPPCQRPGPSCYRQQRLAVLNISMCKLSRYRQFPDPSLHRSVLICNTLRYIEREMEQEGFFFNGCLNGPSAGPPTVQSNNTPPSVCSLPPPPSPHPHSLSEDLGQCTSVPCTESVQGTVSGYHHPTANCFPEVPVNYPGTNPYRGPSPMISSPEGLPLYEQNLRELSSSARATPFPSPTHPGCETDSGMGDDDSGRGINWGSVLSLSSQSDLDPLNNNSLGEFYSSSSSPTHSTSSSSSSLSSMSIGSETEQCGPENGSFLLGDMDLSHEFDDFLPSWKLTPLSADDIIKSVPSTPSEFPAVSVVAGGRQEGRLLGEDLDNIMHVLVGT